MIACESDSIRNSSNCNARKYLGKIRGVGEKLATIPLMPCSRLTYFPNKGVCFRMHMDFIIIIYYYYVPALKVNFYELAKLFIYLTNDKTVRIEQFFFIYSFELLNYSLFFICFIFFILKFFCCLCFAHSFIHRIIFMLARRLL